MHKSFEELKIFTNINENIPKNCLVTIGFFDGVHLGHKFIIENLIQKSKLLGVDNLLITMWPHPSFYFGRTISLLSTYEEKLGLFRDLGISNVLILNFDDKIAQMSRNEFINEILISKLDAAEVVMGYNNSFGSKEKSENQNQFDNLKITKLDKFVIESDKNVNSSQIRIYLEQGDVEKAGKLLGYSYLITGKVSRGYQIGRKIGFPTANLFEIDEIKIIPANGVYIVEVKIKDECKLAMLNIGVRPSFDGTQKSIEFHVLDYVGDLYDEILTVRFLKRLRDERKFEKIDDLIIQLQKDEEETRLFGREK